jgi:hypothetical protein
MGHWRLAMPPAMEEIAAGSRTAGAPGRKFVFLSFRPFANDFRRYLIQELQAAGSPCAHVLLKRGGMEIRSGDIFETVTPVPTMAVLARRITAFCGPDRGVIVNSAGNSAPDIILRLWTALRDQLWIYDVFDELRYDAHGAKRLKWWLTDRAYRMTASGCCLLSPDLASRYGSSFHLDNASHLMPKERAPIGDERLVVTASFDRRTDFDLLDSIAGAMPDITIDLHGSVYDNDATTVDRIDRLVGAHGSVRYHGRFEMDRIGDILGGYAIGLLPYRAESPMTRFINPDKLFHYLCAGLEVIATPIPAVRRFASYIHAAADANAVSSALRRIRHGERRNPGNLHEIFNWPVRARQFSAGVARYDASDFRPRACERPAS